MSQFLVMLPLILLAMVSNHELNSNTNLVFSNAEVIHVVFKDDGTFPNNPLPVILYRSVINFSEKGNPERVEEVFQKNGWGNSWRNGVYGFHHYHSTAHEVLGVYGGSARVRLGGENGEIFDLHEGDVVIIPAGVAHKNLSPDVDFKVVGAYPKGQSWDMNYGKPGERPAADEKIRNVPLPKLDPVFGSEGPVHELWIKNKIK